MSVSSVTQTPIPLLAGFLGFDGIGTTYSAEGLSAAGLSPGATVTVGKLELHLAQYGAGSTGKSVGQRPSGPYLRPWQSDWISGGFEQCTLQAIVLPKITGTVAGYQAAMHIFAISP